MPLNADRTAVNVQPDAGLHDQRSSRRKVSQGFRRRQIRVRRQIKAGGLLRQPC